jgi:hypothetical protein
VIGDVEFDGEDRIAVLGDKIVERGGIPRCRRDAVAGGERGLRERTAQGRGMRR